MKEIWCFFSIITAAIMQALAMALLKIVVIKYKKRKFKVILNAGVVMLFAFSFPIYLQGLITLSLNVVQPIFSATMFLATILLSAFLLKEKIRVRQITGGFIIIIGIVVVLL